ncbi:MAG TPA: hypothetical protein PLI45_04720 [Candidatus Woesebacteria bacterium]|nr:hypothetical protein [Candidatus Woesebacteria bacterium]
MKSQKKFTSWYLLFTSISCSVVLLGTMIAARFYQNYPVVFWGMIAICWIGLLGSIIVASNIKKGLFTQIYHQKNIFESEETPEIYRLRRSASIISFVGNIINTLGWMLTISFSMSAFFLIVGIITYMICDMISKKKDFKAISLIVKLPACD